MEINLRVQCQQCGDRIWILEAFQSIKSLNFNCPECRNPRTDRPVRDILRNRQDLNTECGIISEGLRHGLIF